MEVYGDYGGRRGVKREVVDGMMEMYKEDYGNGCCTESIGRDGGKYLDE
ncbi:hypothetical protein [Staphylococcus capitis]|nr:hypothetical protein [Staphylococcus capitis]